MFISFSCLFFFFPFIDDTSLIIYDVTYEYLTKPVIQNNLHDIIEFFYPEIIT